MIPSKDFTLEFSKLILQLQLAAVHSAFRGKATFLTGIDLTEVFLRHSFLPGRCSMGASMKHLKFATPSPQAPRFWKIQPAKSELKRRPSETTKAAFFSFNNE